MGSFGSIIFNTNILNNYAQCSTDSWIDARANHSESVWVKRNGTAGAGGDGCIAGNIDYTNGHGGFGFLIYLDGGGNTATKISAEMFTPTASAFYRVTTPTTNVCDNNWHNIVLTYDSVAGFLIYLDGVSQTLTIENSPLGTNYTASDHFTLLSKTGGVGLIGANLALFQVWNGITLSSSDVSAIVAGGTNVNSPTASWPFNEGSGTTATDSIGSKTFTFTGSSSNFSWSTDVPSVLAGSSTKKKASMNLVF